MSVLQCCSLYLVKLLQLTVGRAARVMSAQHLQVVAAGQGLLGCLVQAGRQDGTLHQTRGPQVGQTPLLLHRTLVNLSMPGWETLT